MLPISDISVNKSDLSVILEDRIPFYYFIANNDFRARFSALSAMPVLEGIFNLSELYSE